jgi:hypothetical protein
MLDAQGWPHHAADLFAPTMADAEAKTRKAAFAMAHG